MFAELLGFTQVDPGLILFFINFHFTNLYENHILLPIFDRSQETIFLYTYIISYIFYLIAEYHVRQTK